MIDKAEEAVARLSVVLHWLAGLMVAVMMLHITADILGKNLFVAPIHGTLEITTYYYMPIVALAPLAIVQRNREHIFIELFSQGFSDRLNAALDTVMALLTGVFFALIAWYSFKEAIAKTMRNEYVYVVFFDLKIWPTRWVVPAVAAVVVIITLLQVIIGIRRLMRGEPDKS